MPNRHIVCACSFTQYAAQSNCHSTLALKLKNDIQEMQIKDLISRLQILSAQGDEVLKTTHSSSGGRFSIEYVDAAKLIGFRVASLSFVKRVYGEEHPHYRAIVSMKGHSGPSECSAILAIIDVVKGELEGGWLFELKSLVSAEIFADFIEMAEHLLENGYKDAAAVMIGSTLEQHLRHLATINQIAVNDVKDGKDVPKKADRLNADLATKQIYNKLMQKLIVAWLDIRNNAAHGNYDQYSVNQVEEMKSGVLNFVAQIPSK